MNLTHKEYEDIRKQIKKITRGENPELVDDFVQDVILMFLEHPQANELKSNGGWKWFIIRIAINQWRSSTSKFYYKHKKIKKMEFTEQHDQKDIEYDLDQDQRTEQVMLGLDQMFKSENEKHRYEAMIILLYYSTGESFTKLGKTLNQDRTTIGKTFKRGINNLKEHYLKEEYDLPSNISNAILKSQLLKEIQTPKQMTKREEYENWIRDNRLIFFNHSLRNMENINKVFEIYNYFYNTNEQPSGCGMCVANKFNHFKELYFN